MNGDDAAGVIAVRRMRRLLPAGERLLLIEAGLAPENFSGTLRRFQPGLVFLIDAAEMGERPGSIRILDWRDSEGFGPSTHLQPPSTLAEYLTAELNCAVVLIGIQPERLDFEGGMSAAVKRAVRRLAKGIAEEGAVLFA